jgi:hypothetical protein
MIPVAGECLEGISGPAVDRDGARRWIANGSDGTGRKRLKSVGEFHTYIENPKGFIPNYTRRHRHGGRITTGFVGSTVNQPVRTRLRKKQKMQWGM